MRPVVEESPGPRSVDESRPGSYLLLVALGDFHPAPVCLSGSPSPVGPGSSLPGGSWILPSKLKDSCPNTRKLQLVRHRGGCRTVEGGDREGGGPNRDRIEIVHGPGLGMGRPSLTRSPPHPGRHLPTTRPLPDYPDRLWSSRRGNLGTGERGVREDWGGWYRREVGTRSWKRSLLGSGGSDLRSDTFVSVTTRGRVTQPFLLPQPWCPVVRDWSSSHSRASGHLRFVPCPAPSSGPGAATGDLVTFVIVRSFYWTLSLIKL